ncbi:MAG: hypothetical protein ACI81P_000195 [Neolewinella sp.]|jgi:hypothetical protein
MLKRSIPFFFLLCACGGPSDPPGAESALAPAPDFNWMIGRWQRGNDNPGRTTFEQWEQASETLYLGLSYTMVGTDTVWQEKMRLVATETGWTLEVNGEGETIPFPLTSIKQGSFTSENPEHDFPKMITYALRGDSLAAVISGEGTEVPFTFGRKTRAPYID